MADWDGTPGAYWVCDSDGWAYWAQVIEHGTATGLLLDSVTDLGLIDEDYYYAIAQHVRFANNVHQLTSQQLLYKRK